jgi:hypothetical protein
MAGAPHRRDGHRRNARTALDRHFGRERRSEEAVAEACATQAEEASSIQKKPPHGAAAREGAHAQAAGALIESTGRRHATVSITPRQ